MADLGRIPLGYLAANYQPAPNVERIWVAHGSPAGGQKSAGLKSSGVQWVRLIR